MSGVDAPAPWRIAFDNARDPYTARNALGAEKIGGGGGGGGGGAPDSAEYIVAATDATLTNERVLTNTATITWDFTTPGQAKASTAAGGGNVSNSGTPTLGQYAKWTTATTIQGVAPATVLSDIGAQPAGSYAITTRLLTAGAGLTGGGDLSADRTFDVGAGTGITVNANDVALTVPVSVVNGGTGSTTAGGARTNLGAQPVDATLTALAAYNTNGLITQTAADTFTGRSIAVPAAGISISNADGVAGNPTLALANDLAALEALTGTNTIYYRSGTDTWSPVVVSTGLAFSGGNLTATAGGAPVGAQYITAATDATLTSERVLTNTATITWDFATAGQAKANAVAGGGNVSNSGTPVAGQVAEWVTATTIAGVSTYAKLASPTFTGDPKAPTPTAGDNDTSIATTAFVTTAVAAAPAGVTSIKITSYTSGAGTHTFDAKCIAYVVEGVAGGGGGASGGFASPAGGAGGSTSFGALSATGGSGGSGANPGVGGGGFGGSPSVVVVGNPGHVGLPYLAGTWQGIGGAGGAGPWGGGGGGGMSLAGTVGTSGGGGGGGAMTAVTDMSGGGGGSGGYFRHSVSSPSIGGTTASYAVGAGGAAGANTVFAALAGAAGGPGQIIVTEYLKP